MREINVLERRSTICTLTKYYKLSNISLIKCNQIKDDGMSWACSVNVRGEKNLQNLSRKT
jgi:hypothetical protein